MIPLDHVRTPVELQSNNDARAEQELGGLLALALLALVAGGAAGLICAGFRLALKEADRLRDWAIADAHNLGLAAFLLVTGGAGLAVAAAAWLVRRFFALRLRQRHPACRGGAGPAAA